MLTLAPIHSLSCLVAQRTIPTSSSCLLAHKAPSSNPSFGEFRFQKTTLASRFFDSILGLSVGALSLSLSSMLFSLSSNCLFFSLCVSQTLRNKSSPNAAYFPVKHTQFFLFFFLLNLLAFQVAISFYFGHDQVVKVSEKNPPKKTGQSKEELRRRRSAGEHVRAYSGLLEGQVTPGVYSVSQSRGDPVIA